MTRYDIRALFAHMRHLVVCLAISGSLAGCQLFSPKVKVDSRTAPYELSSRALSEEYFHSPSGDIVGKYPEGWLQVNVENDPELDQVLFMYTDPLRANGLVLTELPGSAELRRLVERDGLVALSEESFKRKSARSKSQLMISRQAEIFTVNGNLFASYEYKARDANGNDRVHRAVVFTTGVRFYELSMVQLQTQASGTEVENFRLLQSVIGVLEGVARVSGA